MKKKYIFFTLWYFLFSSIILTLGALTCFAMGVAALITDYRPDQTLAKVIILVMGFLGTIFFTIVFGKYLIQWVRIDESGVYGKCLWGTIAFCKWEDLKEIYIRLSPWQNIVKPVKR